MEAIPKSGFYYPNQFARIALQALADVMGKNGLNAILNLANLSELIDNYPPDNLERQFDFADFSVIQGALEEMYGARGGLGIAQRMGRATFCGTCPHSGHTLQSFGLDEGALRALPVPVRLSTGISSMAKVFSQSSDQLSTVEEGEENFTFIVHRCPACWGRQTDKPACHFIKGFLQEGVTWLSAGAEYSVTQTTAKSAGAMTCSFIVAKTPQV